METKGKKLGPPDKLYFCQTDESLSVHHYAIDRPENKRRFSIYPDANKINISNPRLVHASNSSLQDQDSINSFLKPEQKYSTLSRESLRRQLDYVSASTTSQGSEGKKIRAEVPNSSNNFFNIFRRNSLNEDAVTSKNDKRLSTSEELPKQKTAETENIQTQKSALNPVVPSTPGMAERSTTENSATSMTKPAETKTVKSTKIFSSFPRNQIMENNLKETVSGTATTKAVEKTKQASQPENNTAKHPVHKEDQKVKRSTQQIVKQDSTKPKSQASAKPLPPELNQLQFGIDQNANDSLTMLTKAYEMLLETSFLSNQKQTDKKPGSAIKNQTNQASMSGLPTKPQKELSNLIDKMFNIQPQEKFSTKSNQISEVDSVTSSPRIGQENLAFQEAPEHSKETPTKKGIFDGGSDTEGPFQKKDDMTSNQGNRHTIHEIYNAQTDVISPFENNERFSYSNSQYKTKQKSEKINKQQFSKPRSYYSDSEEDDFTHSEYSDETNRNSYSDQTEGSISPSEGDVKQPQKFRIMSKERRGSHQHSARRQSLHLNYSQSEKFSRKGQERRKNYFKKLYDYTSDKLKKIVQFKPEQEFYPDQERLNQPQRIKAARVNSQKQFATQNTQTFKERPSKPVSQSAKASSKKSASKKTKENNDNTSNKSSLSQWKSTENQSPSPEQTLTDVAKDTQTESLNPENVKKHTASYEDKFNSTDQKRVVEQFETERQDPTDFQTQIKEKKRKQRKKNSAKRTRSPARPTRSQKVPPEKPDVTELNPNESESHLTDAESSVGQIDHIYEQPDRDSASREGRNGKEKGLSTRDKYLKKIYHYLPGSTKRSDDHPDHGLPQKRKSNRSDQENNGEKYKTRSHTKPKSDVSDEWQSDQNSYDTSDREGFELYSYISDSNSSEQNVSHKQTRTRHKRHLENDETSLSVNTNNKHHQSNTASEHTVSKSVEESSADEAKSQKSPSESNKRSARISEDESELTRSERSQKSEREKNKKHLPSTNSQQKTKLSNDSQQTYPSENQETLSKTRDSSSGSLTTLIKSNQNISLSEAETLKGSIVQSDVSGERIIAQTVENKEQSVMSSKPAASTLKPNNAKYDSNLKQFNEFLSSQQSLDKIPSKGNNQQKDPFLPSTNIDQVLPEEATNPDRGSKHNPALQSARPNVVKQSENIVFPQANPDNASQNAHFRIPFSETYLPEKDRVSTRPINKEMLLTKSFQRQYTDSELSVLTAAENFSTAPSVNLSYDTYESAANQPNVRRYHLMDSSAFASTSNQIPNQSRVQPSEAFSSTQSKNATSYYSQPREEVQSFQSRNQAQVYYPPQSFVSKQETGYKDLREKILSERAFESRMKSLQQKQPESQIMYIPGGRNPMASLPAHNNFSNEGNPVSSEIESRQQTINQIRTPTQNLGSQSSRLYSESFQTAGTPVTSLQQNGIASNILNRSSQMNKPQQSAISQRQITQYQTTGPEAYSPGVSRIGPQLKSSILSRPATSKLGPQSYTSNQSRSNPLGFPSVVSRVTTPFSSSIQSQPGFEVFSSATSSPGSQDFKLNQSKISPQSLSSGLSMSSSKPYSQNQAKHRPTNTFLSTTSKQSSSSQTRAKEKTESQIYAGLSL